MLVTYELRRRLPGHLLTIPDRVAACRGGACLGYLLPRCRSSSSARPRCRSPPSARPGRHSESSVSRCRRRQTSGCLGFLPRGARVHSWTRPTICTACDAWSVACVRVWVCIRTLPLLRSGLKVTGEGSRLLLHGCRLRQRMRVSSEHCRHVTASNRFVRVT